MSMSRCTRSGKRRGDGAAAVADAHVNLEGLPIEAQVEVTGELLHGLEPGDALAVQPGVGGRDLQGVDLFGLGEQGIADPGTGFG
jgi:hypothetical protein